MEKNITTLQPLKEEASLIFKTLAELLLAQGFEDQFIKFNS